MSQPGSKGLQYSLPLKTTDISNYENVTGKIPLIPRAQNLLFSNGFVVVNNTLSDPSKSIADVYLGAQNDNVPIFVTSDSALYLYHMAFEGTLEGIEIFDLRFELQNMTRDLLDQSIRNYEIVPENEREAARMDSSYFAVAICLLYPESARIERKTHQDILFYNYTPGRYGKEIHKEVILPPGIANDVEQELALIHNHAGFARSPIFHYDEDYSQYNPRGHYTDSKIMSQYFQAMMWYGRMSFILESNPHCPVIGPKYADIQTKAALLITSSMKARSSTREQWAHIYNVTSLFAGRADDLGPNEYQAAMDTLARNTTGSSELTDESLEKLRAVLHSYDGPEIFSGTGHLTPGTASDAETCLAGTKGFRLMGQRSSPDAAMISRLTYPVIGRYSGNGRAFTLCDGGVSRCYPTGLDIMALLGSERAQEILETTEDSSYEQYDLEYENLATNLTRMTNSDWNRDLYRGWLYSLKPVLKNKGAECPTFMQTRAWRDKDLNAALASWTALRHDTLLYTKANYMLQGTHPGPPPVPGYVEPNPELYYMLENLTNRTLIGLEDKTGRYGNDLSKMIPLYHRLAIISEQELRNDELSPDDYAFISSYGSEIKRTMNEDELFDGPTLIADVYTLSPPGTVLEEGIGKAQLAIVAYKVPDGRIILGVGPVLPYYEFKQPMDQRLTDDDWWQMLKTNPPARPNWTASFTAVS